MTRNVGLDYLRALAVTLVLGIHFFGFRAYYFDLRSSDVNPIYRIFGHGYYGVNVFFVLSGYLIASTAIKSSGTAFIGVDVGRFYLRRVTRILPLLAAVVLLTALLRSAIGSDASHAVIFDQPGATFDPGFWLSIATFSFNWYRIAFSTADGWGMQWDVLWSLAVEEQFYLLFPLAVVLLRRRANLVVLLCGLVLAGVVARALLIHLGYGWLPVLTSSFTCFDSLAIGVLTALSAPFPPRRALYAGLGGAACLTIGYLCVFNVAYGLPVLLVAGGTSLLIQAARVSGAGRPAFFVVADMGRVSYGMYLLHAICLYFVAPLAMQINPALAFLLFVLVTYGVAKLSFVAFERPVERLLRTRLKIGDAARHGYADAAPSPSRLVRTDRLNQSTPS